MRAVNLLPPQAPSRTIALNSEFAAAIALTVLIAVAVLGGFLLERSHAGTERQRLAAVQAVYDREVSRRSAKQTQLQVPAVLSQVQPWQAALDYTLSTRVSWDGLLAQLEYVVPPRVVLTAVNFGSATGAATGATSAPVTLSGDAFTSHDVAVFLASLARVPRLSQVTLVTTTSSSSSGTKLTFQISAQAALPAVAAAPVAPAAAATTGGQA